VPSVQEKWIHYLQIVHYWVHIAVPDVPLIFGRFLQIVYAVLSISAFFLFFN